MLRDPAVALTGQAAAAGTAALAAALASLPAGARVGVLLPASAAQALAVAAVLAAGRAALVLDPARGPERLERRGAAPAALVTTAELAREVAASGAWSGPVLRLGRDGRLQATIDGTAPEAPPPPPGTAVVLDTSGSSGEPKAVALTAGGLLYVAAELARRFRLGPATVAAVTLPLHHTMALNTQLLPVLLAGGAAHVFAPRYGLGRTYRDLLESGAGFVALVSEMLRPCRLERERRGLPAARAVTEVQLAGGPIGPEHLEAARQLFPRARLHKGYGLTEAIRVAMIDSDHPRFAEDGAGFVLPGQQVEVRDAAGAVLPAGSVGEIHVRGPNVMAGYDGEPATGPATGLASDPATGPASGPHAGHSTAGGWLATGDLGLLTADGRLVPVGRNDGVFKSWGRRIAAAEIERAALACPRLAAARCIAVPCPVRGMRPVLFVEPPAGDGGDGLLPAVEAALLAALEPAKMPREIVLLERAPRSASGKVSPQALERLWHAGRDAVELGRGATGCRFRRLGGDPAPALEAGAGRPEPAP